MAQACVDDEAFALEVIRTASEVGVTWLGRADNTDQSEVLDPLFEKLVADAGTAGQTVRLHFERVKHLNSATITPVMAFLGRTNAAGIPVVVTYDADRKWQRLTFRAVERMALPHVEVHGL